MTNNRTNQNIAGLGSFIKGKNPYRLEQMTSANDEGDFLLPAEFYKEQKILTA